MQELTLKKTTIGFIVSLFIPNDEKKIGENKSQILCMFLLNKRVPESPETAGNSEQTQLKQNLTFVGGLSGVSERKVE